MLEDNPAMDLSIPSWDATEISTSLMDLLADLTFTLKLPVGQPCVYF